MRQRNTTSWNTRIATASLVLLAMVFLGAQVVRPNWPVPRDVYEQERKLDNKAEDAFVRARELFDAEKWSAAVAGFEEFVALYPQHRNVPAAHYWLAMALKKQTKYAEADGRLVRLINEFPNSSWANDARALRVELAGLTRNTESVIQSAGDDNENVRLTSLQSLLRLDPPRALRMMAEVLRPDSKESQNMKMSVVTLLGRGGGKAALPLLSQVVNEHTSTELRVHAVYALSEIDDPAVFNTLKGAASSDNKQVAEAALFSIGHLPGEQAKAFVAELARTPGNEAARHQSILLLGQQETDSAVDELLKIYQASEDVDTRKQTVTALGMNRNPRAHSTLIQFYDQEKNEDVKEWIILALAQANERAATRKLMAIARDDSSKRLRQMAVLSLQRSSDPEVRKFLQEMDRNGPEGKE